ncbi:MAG: hypothetical protein LBV75_04070 [Paludibacter sp.]|jgi:hypothetical protein|nr:hypothetical protein [Paludibacter sp.]
MKKLFVILFCIFTSVITFAQSNYEEVVFLKNGKTVRGIIIEQIPNVQIKIETADGTVFTFPMEEIERIAKEKISIVGKASEQPITATQVAEYLRSNNLKVKSDRHKPEHHYLFSLQSGLSYSFIDMSGTQQAYTQYYGLTSEEADKYVNKIKNGFFIDANFYYLTATFFGIGVDYNFFRSATKGDFLVNANSSYGLYGGNSYLPIYVKSTSDERMYLNFIAPSVLFMQHLDETKKIRLTESLAPGVLFMRMESRNNNYQHYFDNNSYPIGNPPMYYGQSGEIVTGTSFAAKIGLSLDYCITSNWSAGLTGNLLLSNIKKVRSKSSYGSDGGTLDEAIEFSHFDYGFVIRYNF